MSQIQASDRQIGGSHYKDMNIEPAEYCYKNGLRALESSVVKYISRWREKGGTQDLEKAKHCIDLIMQYEQEMEEEKQSLDKYDRKTYSPEHQGVDA